MWDALKWQHTTLSLARWALLAFSFLLLVGAGGRAARK
jgi:hypothetical protein